MPFWSTVEVIVVKMCPLPTCRITIAWNTFLQFVSPRAEKEMNAKVMQEIGKKAAGEDGYEGEEGGGGPCSDVGATAVLWRGTTGPIDTAAGGGCHVRANGIVRENEGCKVTVGGCAGTTAGKTVGRWGCGSTMVQEREENESEGTGQR